MTQINFSSWSSLPTWLSTCRVLLALHWAGYTSLSVLTLFYCISVPHGEWTLPLHLSSHPHRWHWQSVWEIVLFISVTVLSSVLSCATQLLLSSPWSCTLPFFSWTTPPCRAEQELLTLDMARARPGYALSVAPHYHNLISTSLGVLPISGESLLLTYHIGSAEK